MPASKPVEAAKRARDPSGAPQWFLVDWSCCLGGGGEGEVYLARSLETMQLYAMKVSSFLDPRAARIHLAAELERCVQASGDGVVGLVAWNLDAPRPFLVFELATAGTLEDELDAMRDANKVYHPVAALERVAQILRALVTVHRHGLVHRDVKPANLLRFGPRKLKLADFGTVRTTDRSSKGRREDEDEPVGTPLYAAPEQQELHRPVDQRADLYAVGRVLYEMLVGDVPDHPIAALPKDNALVLPELDTLVKSLLCEDENARPATAEVALRRVEAVLRAYRTARQVWERLDIGPSPY